MNTVSRIRFLFVAGLMLLFHSFSVYSQLKQGEKIPEIILSDSDGEKYSLNKFAGKILIINFWHDD